jgi:hypothetical protein
MDIYAFTNGRPYYAPDWHDEDVITLFSNVTIDVRNTPPRDDAVMTVLVLFGNATVIVCSPGLPAFQRVAPGP